MVINHLRFSIFKISQELTCPFLQIISSQVIPVDGNGISLPIAIKAEDEDLEK